MGEHADLAKSGWLPMLMAVFHQPEERSVVLDPVTVARSSAQELGAEMDPGLPGCVERILGRSRGAVGVSADGDTLGAFIVAAADAGCRLVAAFAARTGERPATPFLKRQLQREMGIDEGMSPDHDTVIDTVVEVLLRSAGSG